MIGSLRLKKEDTPAVLASAVAGLSLAGILWVVAHHPAAQLVGQPPRALPPASSHPHQAQTLPAVEHHGGSPSSPHPNPGVIVLSAQRPSGGRTAANPPVSPATQPGSPSPSPTPERSPAPPQILSVSPPPCVTVLVVSACVPSIGVAP